MGASDSESEEDEDNSELYSSSGGGDSVGWAWARSLLWLVILLPPNSWCLFVCDTAVAFAGDWALPVCVLLDGGRGIGADTS